LIEGGDERGDAAGKGARSARGQMWHGLGREEARTAALFHVSAVASAVMEKAQGVHFLQGPAAVLNPAADSGGQRRENVLRVVLAVVMVAVPSR